LDRRHDPRNHQKEETMKPSEQIKIGTTRWPVCVRCGRILFPATQDTGDGSPSVTPDPVKKVDDGNE
jgi:hypothetical protein